MNSIKSAFLGAFWMLSCFILIGAESQAQGLRNSGTIINNNAMNAKSFANGKNSVGGTIRNKGTITITAGGSFFNYDSVTNSGTGGTVSNFYGTSGSVSTRNLDNGGTSSHPQGTFANDSSTVGGTTTLTGALTNGSAASVSTSVGTFVYNGVSQTVSNTVLNKTYGVLELGASASGTSLLGGDSTYANTLTLSAGTLDENGKVLVLNGSVSGGSNLTASTTNSTTIYNASGSQNVLASTYYNLRIQNTGQKSAGGAVTVSNLLNVATSSDSLDFAANTFTLLSGAAVTSSGKLKASGTVTVPSTNPTIGGEFVYNGASQTVAGANYSNLTLRGGTKTLPATDTVAVSGTYTLESSPSNTYGSGNSFIYNGSGAQTIVGGQSYFQLIAEGSTDTSITNAKNVASGFTIQNNAGAGVIVKGNTTLDMGANSITFAASHTDSVQGTARIRWNGSNQFIGGTGLTEIYGAGAATLAPGTYGYMWLNGAGTKTISGVVAAQGGSATYASIGFLVGSNLTVAGSGSLTVSGIDLNNNGSLVNDGTITVQ